MQRLFVRPAEGLLIRDPKTLQLLPAEGKFVKWDSYWERRKLRGDVVLVEGMEASPAPAEVVMQKPKKTGDK